MYRINYFLTQLPESFESKSRSYNDDERVNGYRKEALKSGDTKQSILRIVTTEALVTSRIHGSFVILQSDSRMFGPSLSHVTIMAALRFLGFPVYWLNFFKKFLEASVRFIQDGPDADFRVQRNGVPMAHSLSKVFGEATMFCLDFAVNQATSANLYRLYDDIWFWGPGDTSVGAWKIIQEFAEVMGLKLNEEKTGSVQIIDNQAKAPSLSELLPKGKVHWGFLQLEPTGQWIINEAKVNDHIEELQKQLSACKSVFAWVRVWNMYVSHFISNNFGHPANCLGRSHIDMVIEAFQKISRGVIYDQESDGNVTEHLRRKLVERFDLKEVPDGFFYFPIELGGLGLRNPVIPFLRIQKTYEEHQEKRTGPASKEEVKAFHNPSERIGRALEEELQAYGKARTTYDEGIIKTAAFQVSKPDEPVMRFNEFTQYREETSFPLYNAYIKLLGDPAKNTINTTPDVAKELSKVSGLGHKHPLTHPYYMWVMQLYGSDIIRRFGGLALVEKHLLPIRLISMLESEKVKWQGS